jgi:hypothetical protein
MAYTIGWDTTTNRDYFKKLIKEAFDTTDREALVEGDEVFKMFDSKDEYERFTRHAGLGLHSSIADGAEIPLDDPVLDTTKEFRQARWGNGFKITSGMKKFNKWYAVKELTKDLGMTMRESKDIEIAKLFNNLTSTDYAGFDGLAPASNSHTCLDDASSTYDNYLDAALGVSSLEDALVYFDTMIDDQGQIMQARPNKLVVHPRLRFTAAELLGSTLKPDTANNNINSLTKDYDLKYFVYHRLTSTTNWTVMAKDNPKYRICCITSKAPDIQVQDAPDLSRSTVVTSESWFQFGTTDSRMLLVGNT